MICALLQGDFASDGPAKVQRANIRADERAIRLDLLWSLRPRLSSCARCTLLQVVGKLRMARALGPQQARELRVLFGGEA